VSQPARRVFGNFLKERQNGKRGSFLLDNAPSVP